MSQMGENEAKNWALGAHLSGIFIGFIGPLIVWLVKKEESEVVNKQALEALNFQIAILIGYVISGVLMFVCVGFITFLICYLASIVFSILAAMAVSKGEDYRYPFTLRLIK